MVRSTPPIALAVLALALGAAAPAQASGLDHFTVSVSPKPVRPGQAVTLKAIAKDKLGATLTAYSGSGTFADAQGALPATDAPFEGGVATAAVRFDRPLHADTVSVTGDATTSSSSRFDVLGPVKTLRVGGIPS